MSGVSLLQVSRLCGKAEAARSLTPKIEFIGGEE
jgi:hypothetical protein